MKKPFRSQIWFITTLIITIVTTIEVYTMWFNEKDEDIYHQVVIDTTGLRSGDLLLRNGLGTESRFVTGLSNGEYSHIAIAYKDTGGWYAIHAVPGETPHPKDTDYLKCEPIEEFYKYDRAQAGAVARVDCSTDVAIKAVAFALDKVKRKFQFDHKYRLADTTEYYCTELIHQAYLTAGIDLAGDRRHELPMPGTETYFIFPSDILESQHISSIKQLKALQIRQIE